MCYYIIAGKKVKRDGREEEEYRDIWKDVVDKTGADSEGEMPQMRVGIKGVLGEKEGEADTGIATLRAQNGKMVGRLKGKRVLIEHYRKLGTAKVSMKRSARNSRSMSTGGQRRT